MVNKRSEPVAQHWSRLLHSIDVVVVGLLSGKLTWRQTKDLEQTLDIRRHDARRKREEMERQPGFCPSGDSKDAP